MFRNLRLLAAALALTFTSLVSLAVVPIGDPPDGGGGGGGPTSPPPTSGGGRILTDLNGEFRLDVGGRLLSGDTAVAYGEKIGLNLRLPVASLAMQPDGNLVLYKYDPSTAAGMIIRWTSNTAGNPGAYLEMQGDGNLVVYRADRYPLWASGTNGYGSTAHMRLQSDGNLVVYSRDWLWASGTWVTGMPYVGEPTRITSLMKGDMVWSANSQFYLTLQYDGNLVLYRSGVGPTWATNKRGDRVVVQDDGNFVLYNGSQWEWASGTWGYGPYVELLLQDDGNLVLYGFKARWAPDRDRPWYDQLCSVIRCRREYNFPF